MLDTRRILVSAHAKSLSLVFDVADKVQDKFVTLWDLLAAPSAFTVASGSFKRMFKFVVAYSPQTRTNR